MGLCITCEKEVGHCQCGKAAQEKLREMIAARVGDDKTFADAAKMHQFPADDRDPATLKYPELPERDEPPEPDFNLE